MWRFVFRAIPEKNSWEGKTAANIYFLWVVGVESFKIIWVIGVRPNLITWVVGISLRGRGRKNIICQKKGEVLSNLAKRKHRALQTAAETALFVYLQSSKFGCFGKKRYLNKLPNSGFGSGHYFTLETCIFRRI